ncbi:MAG: maleylpyruvate isomerase family mycothiol-dependent enzyme [Acidimicrobiia bacterium]|nr:maleylpyruvate isomerase family mycothiol-dependent enzyme [Acidimicrobiia bacterium]
MIDAAQLADLTAATERMLATAADIDDAGFVEPSLLPGWTRGHVAAHVAGNAEGVRNLMLAARTAKPIPMYASQALRNANIEVGAGRSAVVQLDDLRGSAERLRIEIEWFPDGAWDNKFRFNVEDPESPRAPARALVAARNFEVEMHHIDLDAGYGFADSPPELISAFLSRVTAALGATELSVVANDPDLGRSWTIGAGATIVSGTSAQLLAWLSGRSDGDGVTAIGGTLPDVPSL